MTQAQELKSLVGGRDERRVLLEELAPVLAPELLARLSRILELIAWLLELLEKKNLSIAKLRQLIFGSSTEKSRNPGGKPSGDKKTKTKRKGHGRRSSDQYTGAKREPVPHPTLKAGERCPSCGLGRLYRLKRWAIALKIAAQALFDAVIYELERLRCNACQAVFTAPAPAQAGTQKYDPSVGVMVGMMRYGAGMPLYRLEKLQQSLGVPLPTSVQWEQVNQAATSLEPVFDHLIYSAAQSWLLFSDDTSMRVQDLRRQIQSEQKPQRKGIFTTTVIGQLDEHPIALFFTGCAHAGENLGKVLDRRETGLSPPLHMCDGSNNNTPQGHATVGCQCNVHARRNFVEIETAFPQECRFVIDSLAVVYGVEARAKEKQLDATQRLELHQRESRPVMDRLKEWLDDQIDNRKAEPNSGLGQAITYMRDRWVELTRFLEVPGAPLDNNVSERFLKMSILHRKNSLFYRTKRGAAVGDLFMSLIQTCRANEVNPLDYLLEVVRHAENAKANPARWLPWNYRANLKDSGAPAT